MAAVPRRLHAAAVRRRQNRQRCLSFAVNFGAVREEILRFLIQPALECFFGLEALLGRVFAYVFSNTHRTEMWSAHAAEMRQLRSFLRQSFVMELSRRDRVQA